jgi:hypothetical protein
MVGRQLAGGGNRSRAAWAIALVHRAGKQEANYETEKDANYREQQVVSGHRLLIASENSNRQDAKYAKIKTKLGPLKIGLGGLGVLDGLVLLARLSVLQQRSNLFTELRAVCMSVCRDGVLRCRLEQFLFAAFDS